jgi:hypothetical protein
MTAKATQRNTTSRRALLAPAIAEKPQIEKDFDRHFSICWSVKRIIAQLPSTVGDKKMVLRIVEQMMAFEHGPLEVWG